MFIEDREEEWSFSLVLDHGNITVAASSAGEICNRWNQKAARLSFKVSWTWRTGIDVTKSTECRQRKEYHRKAQLSHLWGRVFRNTRVKATEKLSLENSIIWPLFRICWEMITFTSRSCFVGSYTRKKKKTAAKFFKTDKKKTRPRPRTLVSHRSKKWTEDIYHNNAKTTCCVGPF